MAEDASALVAFIAIIKKGITAKFVKQLKSVKFRGATVIQAKGSVEDAFTNRLGVHDSNREMVITLVEKQYESLIHQVAEEKFHISENGRGILFSIDVTSCYGRRGFNYPFENSNSDEDHQLLWTIVNRNEGAKVVNLAAEQGANGATVLHGRGIGGKKARRIFSIPLELEYDVVLQVIPSELLTDIADHIDESLALNKPGHGIQFTTPVNGSLGMVSIHAANER
ncbi:MAG: P-II family nitrogen regulator [Aerococcus sp.]|nr:P-II family nitrogen regulator [Aerococcus sp.]